MAKTLNDLANRLDAIAKAMPEAASKIAVDTALTIVGDLSFKTPVDTSEALSNWQVTLDAPAAAHIEPHFPGELGSTQAASANENLALAKAVLAKKKPGQRIYATNNAPYIRKLNDGSSTQQPKGFVERAQLLGRITVKNAKLRIPK